VAVVTKARTEPGRRVSVMLPVDLVDELDVECEIVTCSRSLAIAQGIAMWLSHMRRAQTR